MTQVVFDPSSIHLDNHVCSSGMLSSCWRQSESAKLGIAVLLQLYRVFTAETRTPRRAPTPLSQVR